MEAGAPLGRVIDIYGREQAVVVAGKPGFVAAIARPYLPVFAGALISELNDEAASEA